MESQCKALVGHPPRRWSSESQGLRAVEFLICQAVRDFTVHCTVNRRTLQMSSFVRLLPIKPVELTSSQLDLSVRWRCGILKAFWLPHMQGRRPSVLTIPLRV